MKANEMTYSEIKKELDFHKKKIIEYNEELLRRDKSIGVSTMKKWIPIIKNANRSI